jgi:hypothetical protein
MLGRCDRVSIYFVKNQRAEVYSLFPTWRRNGEQGRIRDTSIMTYSHDGKRLSRFGISVHATMRKIVYFFGESA